jgi:general stress protein 26
MMPITDRPVMPGYGVATDDAGLLPWSWAEQRLRDAHNYWLATTSADGVPHLAAVWAVWHDGALWFSTGARSRKAADLTAQPRCSLAPESAAESVVLSGTARRVTSATEIEELQRVYTAKYGSGVPEPGINPVYAVAPDTVVAVIDREPEFTRNATRWRFP